MTRRRRDPLVTTEIVTSKKAKQIREQLGLSKETMARVLGLRRKAIFDNEKDRRLRGIHRPTQLTLMALRDGWRPKGVELPGDDAEALAEKRRLEAMAPAMLDVMSRFVTVFENHNRLARARAAEEYLGTFFDQMKPIVLKAKGHIPLDYKWPTE